MMNKENAVSFAANGVRQRTAFGFVVSLLLDIYTHSDIKQQKIAIDKFEKIVDFTL